MRLHRAIYIFCVSLTLVLVGSVGNVFSGTADSIDTLVGLSQSAPTGVATDSFGNVYVADSGNNMVIMVDATGAPALIVGTGDAGFVPTSGNTGLNTTLADPTIQLNAPSGVAVGANGNLYIADTGNHRIHMIIADSTTKLISPTSRIITIAGSGIAGFSGDGALANIASLNNPTGVAVDASGNIFIADNGNYRIRKVLPIKIATGGAITFGTISSVAGDGTATTLTAYGVAVSPAPTGDLYIADSGNHRILKMAAAAGLPVTIAGSGSAGFSGDGGLALLAQFNQPSGVATDGKDLYIADTMNSCVRKVSLSTGVVSTRAGSAAKAAAVIPITPVPALSYPMGIGINPAGTVYIAGTGNNTMYRVYASISAITTASPPGGTYSTAQTVTLTASKAATISYKINGGTSTSYTAPITISGPATTVLSFTSLDVASHQEVTNTATYVFDSTASITTAAINATPVNGTFYSAQPALTVTLTSNSASSSIYYTTTGTAPTAISTYKYSSPFTIPVTSALATTTVQFFSVDIAGNVEAIQSLKYPVIALNSTASPAGGAYRTDQLVTLASNDPTALIYYTTNGTEPTTTSLKYTAPISIKASPTLNFTTTTLKFRAIDNKNNLEPIKTQIYTIDNVAPSTTASPAGATYTSPQTVTLTPNDLSATIYYTTSGIAPTITSAKYTAPISINANLTLMFFAVDAAGNKETIKTESYIIDSVAPATTASVLTGTYASIQSVALTSNDPQASIYFTTDGSVPTTSSAKYTVPIIVSNSLKLRYFALDLAGNKELVKEQDYTLITLTTSPSPKGGVYNSPQSVVLSVNSPGSSIYFTTDGSDPVVTVSQSDSGVVVSYDVPTMLYTDPIQINFPSASNPSTTLKFLAVDEKGATESLKTEIYTLDTVAPSTTATCGTTANTIRLYATDDIDPLPRIRYVANTATNAGATPAYTLADYTTKVTFTKNTIIKYFSVDAAGNAEPIKTAYCAAVVAPLDPKPALYLETLPNLATTSNGTLFMRGNVAPYAFATLDINGTVVAKSSLDGSFSYLITSPALVAGTNTIKTTVTNGIQATVDSRAINYVTPGTTPTSLAIGNSNGVIGHAVRVPITFSSGYQAAAISIDIAYDPASSRLSSPNVQIAKVAAAMGKIITGGSPSAGVYRILIMDDPGNANSMLPLPDGEIAYLSFNIPYNSSAGSEPLTINSYSVTDLQAKQMTVMPGVSGLVNVVSNPGNNIGSTAGNAAVTLKGVMDSFYMLLNPIVYAVDGSTDLNADGIVQIYELQQVINAFIGQ